MTNPAQRDRPESVSMARATASSTLVPSVAHWLSMLARSSLEREPTSSNPSTKRRNPASVGSRPAEVCGAKRRPASCKSAITLRMVAGESGVPRRRANVREPTGSPDST